jgi:hypothetical protein
MYKCINGWTKKKMIERIKLRNTGKVCVSNITGLCKYEYGKNHCAVGCFIPSNYKKALKFEGNYLGLIHDFPFLENKMPLGKYGMIQLQSVHDEVNNISNPLVKPNTKKNVRKLMINWINENVED